MNKFTIQQLQQMRESEDRVEFKAGEGDNVPYDGRDKTNPKERRRCILGYVIALCNEGGDRLVIGMHDNYPHRVTGTRQAQDAIGQLESSGQGVDKMFYHSLMDGKRLPDYSLTDDWQVCLRLSGEIKYPAFMLYARELQNARPANNKLNVFDLLALFRASQGESQRHTDEVTLRKLIDEELLISAQDGYKLSGRYYEIVKNVGTVENTQKNDTVNVPVNDTVKLLQHTERQKKIYHIIKNGTINDSANVPINVPINAASLATMFNVSEKTIKRDLYVLRDLNLIKYVGSNKTGHWEVIVN